MQINQGVTIAIDPDLYDLSAVHVGLGWDMRQKESLGLLKKMTGQKKAEDFDLDLLAFVLDENGKLGNLGHNREVKKGHKVPLFGSDIIHFNNLKLLDKTVWHSGDNPDGAGPGDDERIILNLDKIASRYHQILFFVIIFEGCNRGQHFGMVENGFIRAVDANRKEIIKFNLSDEAAYQDKCSMLFARIFRENGGWSFQAVGKGYTTDSFVELMREYVEFEV